MDKIYIYQAIYKNIMILDSERFHEMISNLIVILYTHYGETNQRFI
jgi:hypothetical protein